MSLFVSAASYQIHQHHPSTHALFIFHVVFHNSKFSNLIFEFNPLIRFINIAVHAAAYVLQKTPYSYSLLCFIIQNSKKISFLNLLRLDTFLPVVPKGEICVGVMSNENLIDNSPASILYLWIIPVIFKNIIDIYWWCCPCLQSG